MEEDGCFYLCMWFVVYVMIILVLMLELWVIILFLGIEIKVSYRGDFKRGYELNLKGLKKYKIFWNKEKYKIKIFKKFRLCILI